VPGFLLIMAGLGIARPGLANGAAPLTAPRAPPPPAPLPAPRPPHNPPARFPAPAGPGLPPVVPPLARAGVPPPARPPPAPSGGAAARDTVTAQLGYGQGEAIHIQGRSASAPVSNALLTQLHSVQGVQAVALIHTNPLGMKISAAKVGLRSSFGSVPAGLI